MNKKILALCVALVFLWASLAGCSQPAAKETGANGDQPKAETYTMRLANNMTADSLEGQICAEFKKRIEDKTGNRIKVELYPAGQAGAPDKIIEGVVSGTIQGYQCASSFLASAAPGINIIDLPYFFKDVDSADQIVNFSPARKVLDDYMISKGFHPLGYFTMDPRSILGNFELTDENSCKGKKIRVMNCPALQQEVGAIYGGTGVPVAPGEVYTALQQGMIDGVGSGFFFFESSKLHEVAKVVNQTNQGPIMQAFVVSEKWFKELPADLQDTIIATGTELLPWAREKEKVMEQEIIDNYKKSGIKFVTISPELHEKFAVKAKALNEKLVAEIPDLKPIYEAMKAEIDKVN